MKQHLLQFRAIFIALLCACSTLSNAAPVSDIDSDKDNIKVQFVLLASTNSDDLHSEAWNSTAKMRSQALDTINKLRENARPTSLVEKPQELLNKLSRLTQSGQYDVLYATQWYQPKSSSRSSQTIESEVSELPPYNFLYGQLKIFERSALIARLKLHLVETSSLEENFDEEASSTIINTELGMLNSALDGDLKAKESTPILFLEQQQQVKLNKIIYFDHPVTPGFLFVSSTKS